MNDFSKMSLQNRTIYLAMAFSNSNLPPIIIEKDFWVCWTLERLFSLEAIGSDLIFKSNKQQKKLIDELSVTCKAFVQNKLYVLLKKSIVSALEPHDDWELVIDQSAPDGQTILFYYPTAENSYDAYVRPSVKIELGVRSDHWPANEHFITPYLHQYLEAGLLFNYSVSVKVLDIARTFWEKATILHMYAFWPEGKSVTSRQ